MAKTVRVSPEVHAALVKLADEERRPIGQVIKDAVMGYRKGEFWKASTSLLGGCAPIRPLGKSIRTKLPCET